MKRFFLVSGVLLVLLSGLLTRGISTARVVAIPAFQSTCVLASGTNTLSGSIDGSYYQIRVPSNWNGKLTLYSHGYAFSGTPLDTETADAPDAQIASILLQEGYALAGSSYSQNGWAVQQALHDQIALLDHFDATCGKPAQTIVWGGSLGGMVTAGLVQLYPQRFAGALPICGVVDGSVGEFNVLLDTMVALNVLLANNKLQLVHLSDPTTGLNQAAQVLNTAQQTPQGRARIALALALEDMPGELAGQSLDPATQEQTQFTSEQQVMIFNFAVRAELEARAGGNPSWTTGVNFAKQLRSSANYAEVVALYQQAKLDLTQDINALQGAPRIVADPQAVNYMAHYIAYNGDLNLPVLTLHTIGDPLVYVQAEQAYASAVHAAGDANMLRQTFINRAGHCTFTDAEVLTAFQTLIQRINTGHWGDTTNPVFLNQAARQLGTTLNTLPPAFYPYQPAVFLRPFSLPGHAGVLDRTV